MRTGALAALAAVVVAGPASAAGLGAIAGAPPGAASCSGCHAARAGVETAVPPIHGRPEGEIVAAMEAFRSGARPATVMNRIAPGFTPAESRAVAAWLSRQAPQ